MAQPKTKPTEHIVYCGSTRPPGHDGWLYYLCYTCGESETTIYAQRHPDPKEWVAVVDKFNLEHPHTEVREASWC